MNTCIRLGACALLLLSGYAEAAHADGQLSVVLRAPEPGQQQRRLIYDQGSLRILYSDRVRSGAREYFAAGVAIPPLVVGPVRYRGLQRDLHAAPSLPISLDSLFEPGRAVLDTEPGRSGPVGMVARAGNLGFSVVRVDSRWTRAAAALALEADEQADLGVRFVYMNTLLEADEPPGSWRLPASYTRERTLGHLGFELRHRYLRYRLAMPFGATVVPALRMQLGLRLPLSRSSVELGGLIHTPGYVDAQGRGASSEASALLRANLRATDDVTITVAARGVILARDAMPREFRETESTVQLRALFSPGKLRVRGESSLERETDHSGAVQHAVSIAASAGYEGALGTLNAGIEHDGNGFAITASAQVAISVTRLGADFTRTINGSDPGHSARYFVRVASDAGTFRVDARREEDGVVPISLSWTYSGALPSHQ